MSAKGRKKQATVGNQAASKWLWLLTGIVIGAVASGLVSLKLLQSERLAHNNQQFPMQHQPKLSSSQTKHTPKYEFYNMLPAKKPQASQQEPLKKQNKPIGKYVIQAGSFKKLADADELKAKLTLRGFDVHIQAVKLPQSGIWQRVIVGPYSSETAARQQQQLLMAANVHGTLVLKLN